MKFRPLSDYVLLRRNKMADRSDSGLLIIPEQAKRRAGTGEVLAVGPGRFLENGNRQPVGIEPGQVVHFREWEGTEVRIDGEDLTLIREGNIEGVVES